MCTLDRHDWQFETGRKNFFTEFNLYCDRMYIISAGTTIYFLGFFLFVSPLSSLVDKLGRKITTSLFLFLLVGILSFQMLSTSIFQLMIGRFILGSLHGGISVSMTVMFFEFSSSSFATFISMLTGAGFSFGGGLVGLVAMNSSHWQNTMIPPILAWVILGAVFCYMVPESPYWLFAKGCEMEALASFNKIAYFNGAPPLENVKIMSLTETDFSAKKPSVGMLWEVKFLRTSLASLSFVWFTVSLCYYGLEFNAGSLGNEYVVMMIMGCFDTPFKIYMYVFANKRGRQIASQVYLGGALFCLICTGIPITESIFIAGNMTLKTLLVACGRAFGGSVFALLYVYTLEILPTLVRSVGVSFCSTVARVGSLIAPLVILVNEVSPLIIYVTIIICLVLSMRLLRNIPETLGKPLPSNLQDCRKLFDIKK